MVIKKYTTKQKTAKLHNRLEAYERQVQGYRKTRKKQHVNFKALSAPLAALIPLAAAGSLNAQCLGPANGGATIILNSTTSRYYLDVDGTGGPDLTIYFSAFGGGAYMTAQAGFAFLASSSYVQIISASASVTRGQSGFTTIGTLCYNGTGNFCINGTSGFIGIRKGGATTGQPGWIQFDLVSLGGGSMAFKILNRGVEVAGGNNSAVAGTCESLPIEMTHFDTKVQGRAIALQWGTASELNNAGFEVQRSLDGKSFYKIGWVQGQGISSDVHNYSFIDDDVKSNTTYYYRLKQMDNDGSSEFSVIRTGMLKDENAFEIGQLFPNPASNSRNARFHINMPEDGELGIEIYNTNGAMVKSQSSSYSAGSSTISIPTGDLQSGQYFVKLQMGDSVVYRKLVVG